MPGIKYFGLYEEGQDILTKDLGYDCIDHCHKMVSVHVLDMPVISSIC